MDTFKKFFLYLSPLFVYRISGNSMRPTYHDGDLVIGWRLCSNLTSGDVIVLRQPDTQRIIIKRISKIDGGRYFVLGDNSSASTDSRHFGWIEKKAIIAKVLWTTRI